MPTSPGNHRFAARAVDRWLPHGVRRWRLAGIALVMAVLATVGAIVANLGPSGAATVASPHPVQSANSSDRGATPAASVAPAVRHRPGPKPTRPRPRPTVKPSASHSARPPVHHVPPPVHHVIAPPSSEPSTAPATDPATDPVTASDSPTSPPPAPSSSAPAPVTSSSQFPTADTTGVPAGTVFSKTVNGDYTATAGQVLDGWHITGDLTIGGARVSVTDTEVDGTVLNQIGDTDYGPWTITDSTVGPASGCIQLPGVGESDYVADGVRIRGHDDGFRMSGPDVTVENSYVKDCYSSANGGSHSDSFQAYCPNNNCDNLVYVHNTDDSSAANTTSAFNTENHGMQDPTNVLVKDNLFMGGSYSVYNDYTQGPTWIFTDNAFVRGTYEYAAATAEGTCGGQSWSGNTLVTVNSDYEVTSTIAAQPCIS